MTKCSIDGYRKEVLMMSSAIALIAGVFGSSAALAQSASAQPATADTPKEEPAATGDIVVTGVRGKPRSVLDSPTPVDVLPAKDLAQSGQPNLYASLQNIIPSFNMPFRAGSGTGTAIRTGSLRGLDPSQTLVLVNGHRFHRTSIVNTGRQLYNGSVPVDLGMIPSSGIDHIEVLREGAAAQYGSDAVAGVINILLKNTPGGSISTQYGQAFDRGDGALLRVLANYGMPLGPNGSINFFYTGVSQHQSNRTYAVDRSVRIYPNLPQYDALEAAFPRNFGKAYGEDPYVNNQGGYNARLDVGDVQLYSDASFTKRDSLVPYPLVAPIAANSLPQIYPNGFFSNLRIHELDGQIAFGAKGKFGEWNWDVSTTAGINRARETTDQNLNPSLGPTSPTAFYLGRLVSKEWDNSIDVTRDLDLGSAGDLQVSFGAQHRYEAFSIGAGQPESYIAGTYTTVAPGQTGTISPGAVNTPGFQPSNAGSWHRNIVGGYLELGYSPTEKLFIGASGRFEHYSDSSGNSVVGKLTGRYEVNDWFALRGSFGNGFHAPALGQSNFSSIVNSFSTNAATLGQILPTAILRTDDPAAKVLGATPLRPEKSVDFSLGFTLNPLPNFNVTVDGYQVKVNHRIALTGIISGAAVNAILVANGFQPGLSAQYFTNAIDTRTRGVDVVATYRHDLGDWGDLRLNAAFNYNDTKITNIIPNPSALSSLGPSYVLFDRLSQGYLTVALPKTKVVLGANWNVRGVEFNLTEVRYGKYSILNNTTSLDRTFPAAWITSASVKVKLTDRLSVAVGGNNIFNVYPPATGLAIPTLGQNQYNGISPFGITGGSWYGRVQVDF